MLIRHLVTTTTIFQRSKERAAIPVCIGLRDKGTNGWMRSTSKVTDMLLTTISNLKWNYAGHVERLTEDSWNNSIIVRQIRKK